MTAALKSALLILGGAAIGATAALFTAPSSGRDTRRKLKRASGELAQKVSRVASATQEACKRATVAGREAFTQEMNASALQPQTIPQQHH
ncbi:MAG TPA: YtxH domain-containing protein [Candidatus Polarisedimenticolia bacterium]|nr:YtxH domain-containing protein [Candidatus Polarisedimenticolia bacterium]